MRRGDLFTGGVYRAKHPRGRAVRVVRKLDHRRGRLTWDVPSWARPRSSDGRRLRAGRRCTIASFIRWAHGIAQLDLFGAPASSATARPAGDDDRPEAPLHHAGPPVRFIGRGSAQGNPGPALLRETINLDD